MELTILLALAAVILVLQIVSLLRSRGPDVADQLDPAPA